jgi:predicted glutamine amidotransferase
MCRIAAYLGPPRSVHELWLAPAHNLVVQSYAPREMNGALLNADGFGMAWYTPAHDEPALYRTILPMWNDENLVHMSRHIVTGCALANVRSATPGMGVQTTNVSPFVRGRAAITHNGYVKPFAPVLARIRPLLADESTIRGNTDSEYLCALIVEQGVDEGLRTIETIVREESAIALLAFVITDGRSLTAVRRAIGAREPSLYLREGDGVEIAS